MRSLFYLLPILALACTTSSDKDDGDTGSVAAADEDGADGEDWWEDGDSDGGGADGDWELVNGFSYVGPDFFFETSGEAWAFMEDFTEEFEDDRKDGHEDADDHSGDDEGSDDGSDDEANSLCILTVSGLIVGCAEFTGVDWGSTPEFDPETACAEVAADHEAEEEAGSWSYLEGECDDDPKAVCVFDEGTGEDVKLHSYNPLPIDEIEETCLEGDGVFYDFSGDDDDDDDWDDEDWDDEEDGDLGTRWVGIMLMDGSFGIGMFEHFTEDGDKCRASTTMSEISEVEACDDCEFARSFQLGAFDYEVEEGEGCPREDLDEVTGLTITMGHGTEFMFEDDEGMRFNSLYTLDEE